MNIVSSLAMQELGVRVGRLLRGGECVELIGDVGAGKTTFTQGIGEGLAIDDDIQSPSFTISREYAARDGLRLAHYDFYRLTSGGVLDYELAESLADPQTITVVEWGQTISAVLPDERLRMTISSDPTGEERQVALKIPKSYAYLEAAL